MVNYSNGKIYMIRPTVEHDDGEIYIGSTSQYDLSDRMFNHKIMYERYKYGIGCGRYSVYDLFDKYGVHNCDIFLIENFSTDSKNELHAREGYHIRNTKCVNKIQTGQTREGTLEKKRQYKKNNTEKIRAYNQTRKEIMNCVCGGTYNLGNRYRHIKTKLHSSFCVDAKT